MSGPTISALPGEALDRVRARGVDDVGNPLVVAANREAGGAPLRCCLQEARVGEDVALLAWRPARSGGAYAEVGPVFVHAGPCGGCEDEHAYPAGFRHRRQLFRAYDEHGRQVDNVIVEGAGAEAAISDLFSRPDVDHLHSRNPLAGCYMFTIHRAGRPA